MTHGTTIETETPTYSWATAVGAGSSILGLVGLAVCITVSASNRTAHGYEPMPAGTTALAGVLVLGGLILLLFRILHGDREELDNRLNDRTDRMDSRMDRLVEHLEAIDEKLNSVWGIAAKTSLEARPARTEQHARRGRRRKRAADNSAADNSEGSNVVPLRTRKAKEALRRLTEHITGEPDA